MIQLEFDFGCCLGEKFESANSVGKDLKHTQISLDLGFDGKRFLRYIVADLGGFQFGICLNCPDHVFLEKKRSS
jgi:hypothetical protein